MLKYFGGTIHVTCLIVVTFWNIFGFIECITTTFLHTHSWLNWVDEDDLMRMRLDWIKSQKTLDTSKYNTSKWEPKHRECGQRTWFPTLPLLGAADSGMGRVVTPWRVLGRGEIHTQWMLVVLTPQSKDFFRIIITDHHPGSTKSPFTTYRVRGVLLPRSSTDTPLLDLCPEAEHTFAPFRDFLGMEHQQVTIKFYLQFYTYIYVNQVILYMISWYRKYEINTRVNSWLIENTYFSVHIIA